MRAETAPTVARPSVLAGAVAGLVPALSFWVFHTLWIRDVPAVLFEGIAWGLASGAAVGWAFHHLHLHAGYPTGWRGGALLAATFWLLLLPYEAVGLAFGPFTHLTRPADLLAIAPVGLLGVPVAAALGWALMRRARSAGALALATLLSSFMMGGSIVYFGGRGTILGLLLWLLPTYLVAGQLFVRVRAALVRRDTRAPVVPLQEVNS